MKIILADAEWNGETGDRLYVVCTKDFHTGEKNTFLDKEDFREFALRENPDKWVFHAGLTADTPVINSIMGAQVIDPKKVIDTFVVSRLVDYKKFNTHSLDEIGGYLGCPKSVYTGGWSEFNPDMVPYCEQDVEVLSKVFSHFFPILSDPKWADAMRLEHDIAIFCQEMHDNGFAFDSEKAEELLSSIQREKGRLEKNFKTAFGTNRTEVKRIKLRYTKEGNLYKNVEQAFKDYPDSEVQGSEVVCFEEREFNPASPKERIDALWDAGWKPFEKTKGHKDYERSIR